MSGIDDNLTDTATTRQGGLLRTLGLDRPELRAWAMYDWAISGMQAVILASVFPIFFASVPASHLEGSLATGEWNRINVIGAVIVAVLAPILGAMADYAAMKKRMIAVFMLVGVSGLLGMFFIRQGDLTLATVTFLLTLVGSTASLAFYESLLPHIARPSEIDRVSSGAYAIGYLGGGLLLALNLAWIQKPEWFGLPSGVGLTAEQASLPSRLAFVSVAVWWVVFALPLFFRVREPARRLEADEVAGQNPVGVAFRRLGETFRELRHYKHAVLMLVAFMIYNDGIQTIIKSATIYGNEIGIGQGVLIGAILIVQFVGVPFAFLFGWLAGKLGTKRAIFLGLAVYTLVSVVGFFIRTGTHFLVLALLVATVQGGTQALSRSLFASMVPAHKSGEFFGFYSVFEKFASILGPLFFWFVIVVLGQPTRMAVLGVILFFVVGALVLTRVNVSEGQRVAREAEERTRIAGDAAPRAAGA